MEKKSEPRKLSINLNELVEMDSTRPLPVGKSVNFVLRVVPDYLLEGQNLTVSHSVNGRTTYYDIKVGGIDTNAGDPRAELSIEKVLSTDEVVSEGRDLLALASSEIRGTPARGSEVYIPGSLKQAPKTPFVLKIIPKDEKTGRPRYFDVTSVSSRGNKRVIRLGEEYVLS